MSKKSRKKQVKVVTKTELKEQYLSWKNKHQEESTRAIQKLQKFKQPINQQSPLVKERLESLRAIPSLTPVHKEVQHKNPLKDLDYDERQEYLRREKLAQEEIELKKSRVAPTYNKGGGQYWSDGMIGDIKGGGHRRR